MAKAKILVMLSVMALLASVPIAALAQGGDAQPVPPFQVVGNATIDGEPAMDGTMVAAVIDGEKAGSGTVLDGKFSVDVIGEIGEMIMFYFLVGEGDEAIKYMATTERDVTVGPPGVPKIVNLTASSDDAQPLLPPFQVVGIATIDGEPAMDGTVVVAVIDGERAGSGTVLDGKFSVDVIGEIGEMIMFYFLVGEGDEAIKYMATTERDVTVGAPGVPKIVSLIAYSDATPAPIPDECVDEIGTLTGTATRSGSWASDYESSVSGRGYARYYTFSLTQDGVATIDLESGDANTYLYLREGETASGTALHENDDHQGSTGTSRIQETLAADTYTVEATTNSAGAAGSFTLTIAVEYLPTVNVSRAAGSEDALVRLNSPIPLTATFSRPVFGFTVDDITVIHGTAVNFAGSDGDSSFAFDVSPNALGEVTVAIAAGVATDGAGAGNTEAPQLSLGIPYDFDRSGGIGRNETIAAIVDYFDGRISRNEVIAVIVLYFSAPTEPGPGTPEGDRAALVALYNATGGPNWERDSNWLSEVPISEWEGVTTDDNGRITGLRLSGNQLSGEIPPELGNLNNLTRLSLGHNQLSGEIPPELGNLNNLTELFLGGNQLSEEIPPELANLANLTRLSLGHNQLSGEIPPELGNLNNLTELFLGGNQLSEVIPPELANLANLTKLSLGHNQLSGEIPPELGNLASLTQLSLGRNQLSGEIPLELGNLVNLASLSLGGNQLSGEIPPWLGNLTNLTWLGLNHSQLSGEIPPELGNLTNLTWLGLNHSQLSGEIPPELGNLTNLKRLDLYENQLSGDIPPELGNLVNLASLSLGGNQLSGEIPPWLGNLTNLTGLGLYWNQLSGDIPPELGNLANLLTLHLSGNQLSGDIPPELGNLVNLTSLYLNGNQLSGDIPPELGNLVNLRVLYLNGNQLTGCVPNSLSGRVVHSDLGGHQFCP